MSEFKPARSAGSTPSSSDVIAAMFEDRASAVSARDSLVASGIHAAAVDIVDQPSTGAVDVNDAGHGLWSRIRALFVPHEHAHGYAEGVERGHALLFVRYTMGQHERIIEMLEQQHPIDVMSRVQQWTGAGWNGVHRSQAAAPARGPGDPPQMLFEDHPYQDHMPSTGLINENDRPRGIGAPLVNPMGIPVPGVRVSGSNRVRRYAPDTGIGEIDAG